MAANEQQVCKGCGAPIRWIQMRSGKGMPVDAKPFKMIVIIDGIAGLREAWMPHWATCPKARDFKRRSR